MEQSYHQLVILVFGYQPSMFCTFGWIRVLIVMKKTIGILPMSHKDGK